MLLVKFTLLFDALKKIEKKQDGITTTLPQKNVADKRRAFLEERSNERAKKLEEYLELYGYGNTDAVVSGVTVTESA